MLQPERVSGQFAHIRVFKRASVGGGSLVPEKRIIQADDKDISVCSFQLAIDKGFGENKRTIFPRFSARRHDADFICDYGQKGQEVTVQCEYDIREAQVSGENRVFHEFAVSALTLHRGKGDGTAEQPNPEHTSAKAAAPKKVAPPPAKRPADYSSGSFGSTGGRNTQNTLERFQSTHIICI